MKTFFKLVALGVLALILWNYFRTVPPPPGAFLKTEPAQKYIFSFPFKKGEYTIFPITSFQVDGRVLSCKPYSEGREAQLSPMDIAIGWGPMIQGPLLEGLTFSQDGRFFHWHSSGKRQSSEVEQISTHTANIHLIPANDEIALFLTGVRSDQLISLRGRLVFVTGPNSWHWSSSLRRDDRGEGACELLYLEQAVVLNADQLDAIGKQHARMDPKRITPKRPQHHAPPSRPPPKTFVLRSELSIPLAHGSLSIPPGEQIEILDQKGSRTQARFKGFEFWISSSALR